VIDVVLEEEGSDHTVSGRAVLNTRLDIARVITREEPIAELEFHFPSTCCEDLSPGGLPLDPIAKARVHLLTDPVAIRAALKEFHTPLPPYSLRLPESPPDTPPEAGWEPHAGREEGGWIKLENLILLGIGLELGTCRVQIALEGLRHPPRTVTLSSEGDHDGTIRSVPGTINLEGGLGAHLVITIEATRVFLGTSEHNPPNNAQRIVVSKLRLAVADLLHAHESKDIIATRVNRRFPKVSPLAASEGLSLQFGLLYIPPGHPSLRVFSEGECVKMDYLEKVEERGPSFEWPGAGLWKGW